MGNKEVIQKVIFSLLVGGLAFLGIDLCMTQGLAIGFIVYLLPLLVLAMVVFVQSPLLSFFLLYTVLFVVLGITRYVEFPFAAGLLIDILIVFNFLVIILNYLWGRKPIFGKVYMHPILLLSVGWMGFCLLEVFNPMTTVSHWSTSVRAIGIYIVAFQVLVLMVLNDTKKLQIFFKVWGVLVLLAALKAIGQKHIGFDDKEAFWLYNIAAHTHVIYSGIRYFSFYTDAANFGCNMGLAMVFFTILSIHEQVRSRRIFYIVIVLLSTYCLMISGTRAAMAVPIVGFATWVVLVKEWKWIIVGCSVLGLTVSFFVLTSIGQGNAEIRRMRTAFEFSSDASFNVRIENQEKMRAFMKNYPFGIGLGSAKNAVEGDLIYGLATDSSLVFVWVETGVVGLIFYILIFLVVLAYGTYYIWVVLKDPVVKGITTASTAGIAGMLVAGYANEVLHQLPTGPTVYVLIAIIIMSPYLDKQQLKHA